MLFDNLVDYVTRKR